MTLSLRLHDTLSGETRPFEPLSPGRAGVYSCGPTVYGPAHVGNFRSFLFADVLVRYLRYQGLEVRWVMNVTDIDDKIIKGAARENTGIRELADRWLERFQADADALRMSRPDVLPRARRVYSYAEAIDANGQVIKRGGKPLTWGGRTMLCTREAAFEISDQKECQSRGLNAAGFASVELAAQGATTLRFKEP